MSMVGSSRRSGTREKHPPTMLVSTPADTAEAPEQQHPEGLKIGKHQFSDASVELEIEDTLFAVHKSVLAYNSTFFADMFSGKWKEGGTAQQPVDKPPRVKLGGIKAHAFAMFLDVIYDPYRHDEVWLDLNNLLALSDVCDYLHCDLINEQIKLHIEDEFEITWNNVEDILSRCNPLIENQGVLRTECEHWLCGVDETKTMQALFLAEKHNLSIVLDLSADPLGARVPQFPYKSEHFKLLSAELRERVLLTVLKKYDPDEMISEAQPPTHFDYQYEWEEQRRREQGARHPATENFRGFACRIAHRLRNRQPAVQPRPPSRESSYTNSEPAALSELSDQEV
ncbi:uncharacterized protein EV422DRAFT_233105 [Fimicolochytrium jonesii]|uniref:uncharacterized protein n=1 Tax=Fimicolochytrium jonesii TaxID=1396493 RepID=UPI0022FE19F5|nr:uncharacterized protein EV422DRAFT_233105 [Fimicolochytrium jonesii]KAI8824777.1 hypothetical protein EV422DRAFT_233105 [Fimicolochytrium jonesii]